MVSPPRVPRIQTEMDDVPRTPVMQQQGRWRSTTPDSPPDFANAPSVPGSPDSPISPTSPATPHADQWGSLDDQVAFAKTSSPRPDLQSRILSRQASLRKQQPPKQIGGLTLGRQVGSGTFSKTFEARGPQGLIAVKLRLPTTSLELFVHEQQMLTKLALAASQESSDPVGIIKYFPESSGAEHSVFKLYDSNLEAFVQGKKYKSSEDEFEFFDYRAMSQPIVGLDRWVRWALELVHGLQFIHSQGIVHADMKPDNVLVREDTVCISDFSGSVDVNQTSESLLQKSLSNGIAGSAVYTDPELLYKSKVPSFGSDIYALGLILAFCATGKEPYGAARNTVQRLMWLERAEPLDSFDADVQSRLAVVKPVIERCLSRTLDGVVDMLERLR